MRIPHFILLATISAVLDTEDLQALDADGLYAYFLQDLHSVIAEVRELSDDEVEPVLDEWAERRYEISELLDDIFTVQSVRVIEGADIERASFFSRLGLLIQTANMFIDIIHDFEWNVDLASPPATEDDIDLAQHLISEIYVSEWIKLSACTDSELLAQYARVRAGLQDLREDIQNGPLSGPEPRAVAFAARRAASILYAIKGRFDEFIDSDELDRIEAVIAPFLREIRMAKLNYSRIFSTGIPDDMLARIPLSP